MSGDKAFEELHIDPEKVEKRKSFFEKLGSDFANTVIREVGSRAAHETQKSNPRAFEIVMRLLRGTANLSKFGADFIPGAGTVANYTESALRTVGIDMTPDISKMIADLFPDPVAGKKFAKYYELVVGVFDLFGIAIPGASIDNLLQGVYDYYVAGKTAHELVTLILQAQRDSREGTLSERGDADIDTARQAFLN